MIYTIPFDMRRLSFKIDLLITAADDYEQLNFTPDHGNSGKVFLFGVENLANYRHLPHESYYEQFLDAGTLPSRN